MKNQQAIEISIGPEADGERIDAAIAVSLEEVSRSYVQKLIEMGEVGLNGAVCKAKSRKVADGDIIRLVLPEPEDIVAMPENIQIDVVFEDEEILIINKNRGMVVHPAPGNERGTIVNAVLYHCQGNLSSINGVIRPGIVHRLDKDTSGLLMIAKTDQSHRSLSAQLSERKVARIYNALVYNNFTDDEGIIDAPIGRDPKNRLRQAVTEFNSRHAVTHYKVLERFGRFTHIEARLETGRTHQIRVHMAHIKHPLVGDKLYGPKKTVLGEESHVLHAGLLGFAHPKTNKYMEFESELPEYFRRLLSRLKGE